MNSNKILAQQYSIAMKIGDIYNPEVKKKLFEISRKNTIFPSPDSIYKLYCVIENDPYKNENRNLSKKKYENLLNNDNVIFHSKINESIDIILNYNHINNYHLYQFHIFQN